MVEVLDGAGARVAVERLGPRSVSERFEATPRVVTLQSGATTVSLNGSGRVVAGRVRGERATANLNGSGQLRLAGSVRSLSARSNGSGHLDLADLVSEQADLSSTGSGGNRSASF